MKPLFIEVRLKDVKGVRRFSTDLGNIIYVQMISTLAFQRQKGREVVETDLPATHLNHLQTWGGWRLAGFYALKFQGC